MKRLFLFIIGFLACVKGVNAHDIESNGVFYNILDSDNVVVTFEGDDYTSFYKAYSGDITVPSSIRYNGHTYVVKEIGEYAFSGSGITSISLPQTITTIGYSAFSLCRELKTVSIQEGLTEIGERAFSQCGIATIALPKTLIVIGEYAFNCSKLKSVSMQEGLTTICCGAFEGCSVLNNIVIPNSVTRIEHLAFCNCTSLSDITIGDNIEYMGASVFAFAPICNDYRKAVYLNDYILLSCKSDIMPEFKETTRIIAGRAVSDNKIVQEIIVPNNCTFLGEGAFLRCSNLEKITLGENLERIDGELVSEGIKEICVKAKNPPICDNSNSPSGLFAFHYVNKKACKLLVPYGCKSLYEQANHWKEFENIIEMENNSCATPSITIQNNELVVTCETEGAEIHTTITSDDINTFNHKSGDAISLTGQYLVTSYATVGGSGQSEPATAVLVWSKAADVETGVDAIDMNTDRALLIRSVGENIEIAGTSADETISLYNMSGQQLYTGKSTENATTIPVALTCGEIYIIKIGEQSIKYKF